MRMTEQILFETRRAGNLAHLHQQDLRLADTLDHSGVPGRFHHVTYAVDSREDVLRAADICLEHGVYIETGPHKHAIQQTFFLYLYEPGGNRVEVAMPARGLFWRRTGKPSSGTRLNGKKAKLGGSGPSSRSTATAPRPRRIKKPRSSTQHRLPLPIAGTPYRAVAAGCAAA